MGVTRHTPIHSLTLSGNTAGALQLLSSGTVTLAGGNNITLSQAGNAVTISGANLGGAQTGISGLQNSETTYTSGTVDLQDLGAITIRSTTGQAFQFEVPATSSLSATGIVSISTNGSTISIGASQSTQIETQTFIGGISASDTLYTSGTVRLTGVGGGVTVSSNTGQRVDISVAAQSVQPETQTFISGISASNTLYTSGNVRFSGSQAVTVRSGTGQLVVIDAPAQSVQPETQTFIAGVSASDTLYTSGNVRFTGVGGGITVSSNTGQRVDLSVAAQSVQPETQTFVGGVANSQTTYTSGTVTLSELGAVTIRSTTGQQFQISVNSQTVQTQGGFVSMGVSTGGNTAGNTQVSTGSRFVLVASGNATASQATAAGASTVTISVGTQTVQTQGGFVSMGVSTGGNTAGNTQVSTGSRFVIVASGPMTASQATAAGASTVTLSVAAQSVQPETQTFIAGISASDTLYTSGNVRLTGVGGGVTVSSNTGQRVDISVAAQSVQPETQTFIAGIQNSETTYTSGSVKLSVVGGPLTIRSTTGQAFQFSAAAQSVQPETQTAISGIANSQTTYTSGTVSLSELGAITIRSTTGNQFQFSVNSQTVQTQNVHNVTLSGNTAGAMAHISSGTMTLAGGNGITLSQAGNAVTISGGAGGAGFSAGMSTEGNTAGDTGVTGTRLVLVGSNHITLSQTTGAAGGTLSFIGPNSSSLSATGAVSISTDGSTISIGAPTQTVQTQGGFVSLGVSTGGNTAGNTQVSTGSRFVLVASGNLTASQATAAGASTVTLSVAAQSVQPETQTFLGGLAASNTTYTSGTMTITGVGGGVTVSSNTGQRIDISVAAPVAQTVQTQGGFASLGVSTGGNTAGNTQVSTGSRFVLVASGNATASQATAAGASTVTISVGTQTVQTQNVHNVTLSGNTAGAMAHISSGTMTLAGGNNITLSQAGNAVTISGAAAGAGQFSGGVSTGGNTAGATGITGTQMVLVGTSNITLSQTTGANGGTVSILGAAPFSAGMSTEGNTAGNTGVTGTRLVLVGSGPISLSQTTGAAGGTLSINAPATSSLSATGAVEISTNGSTISIGAPNIKTLADWQNMPVAEATILMTNLTQISKTPFYFPVALPGRITANSFAFKLSVVTGATLQSFSAHAGIYTAVNSTSMALLGSWSESYVLSTASSASWTGIRNFAMTGIGTHTALSVLNGNDYVFGMMFSGGASQSMHASLMGVGTTGGPLGVIKPGANQASTGTSQGIQGLNGRGSTTVNVMPANVVASELINQGQGASMVLHPWIYIRS